MQCYFCILFFSVFSTVFRSYCVRWFLFNGNGKRSAKWLTVGKALQALSFDDFSRFSFLIQRLNPRNWKFSFLFSLRPACGNDMTNSSQHYSESLCSVSLQIHLACNQSLFGRQPLVRQFLANISSTYGLSWLNAFDIRLQAISIEMKKTKTECSAP